MTFQFEREVEFSPEGAEATLLAVPTGPGVFALYGARPGDEPYVTRAADLRRRMRRLLEAGDGVGRRLNLRSKVARIAWSETGSEFESLLVLYEATAGAFGVVEARRRMRLHTPFFLRFTVENAHPRVYSTNRLSRRGLGQMFGPFPSRAGAERYCDEVLGLFRLRRCYEDLKPFAEHPGCAYGEMKKCLAPCNLGCSGEEYGAEAEAVRAFLATRGESMLEGIAAERERASAEMQFEAAAAAHERYVRVKAVAGLADEVVSPVPELRAVVVQEGARGAEVDAAVFLMQAGCVAGPERLSTLGVRAVKEQTAVGSSLFAQPLMLQAVPLEGASAAGSGSSEGPEERAERVLRALQARVGETRDLAVLSDHLSLFRRWYYRPEKQRRGEVFLANADGSWPVRRILRGAARMALGEPKGMQETDRAGAKGAKTRILHEGREGVERVVPVVSRGGE